MVSVRSLLEFSFGIAAVLAASAPLVAQFGGNGSDGPLHPTADLRLDTTARPGGWNFTDIDVPAGVTVRFEGSFPVICRSRGLVRIAGRITADGHHGDDSSNPGAAGPGGFRGGFGSSGRGAGPAGGSPGFYRVGWPSGWYPAPTNGQHAGAYGSTFPFDVRGGSGGGGITISGPGPGWSDHWSGGGGGVLVLLADGPIEVLAGAAMTANGGGALYGLAAKGAGGSVMLRTGSTMWIAGTVEARGGTFIFGGPSTDGPGFVRLDAFGTAPVIAPTASIFPLPDIYRLPYLTATDPLVGGALTTSLYLRPADLGAILLGFGIASTPTPFGTLELDLRYGTLLLGIVAETRGGLEPAVSVTFPWPADPALRGTRYFLQGLAAPTIGNGPVSLSNAVAITVR